MSFAPSSADALSIRLPKKLGRRNLDAMLGVATQVFASNQHVVLDGQDVEFIDPLGIAILGATLQPLVGAREVRLEWLPTDVGSYLGRMKVLSECGIGGVETRSDHANDCRLSLVELTRVANQGEVDLAAGRLSAAIAGVLLQGKPQSAIEGKRAKYAYPLHYSLSELLLNALTHAKKNGRTGACVWVAAQFYPKSGTVDVAVVDNGCGILATLQGSNKLTNKTHVGAIECALEPFVTCNPDLGIPFLEGTANRGIGLTTTRRIAAAAGGSLLIASGDAVVTAGTGAPHARRLADGVTWPGVAILLSCQRSKLPSVNVPSLFPEVEPEEDFTPRFVG